MWEEIIYTVYLGNNLVRDHDESMNPSFVFSSNKKQHLELKLIEKNTSHHPHANAAASIRLPADRLDIIVNEALQESQSVFEVLMTGSRCWNLVCWE